MQNDNRIGLVRDRTEITAEVLKVAQGGAAKTRIVYRCNLNFNIIKKYLRSLLQRGLLRQDGTVYTTTPKGEHYIRLHRSLSML